MKLKFLLADEVRAELSGKQTIIGLYADDVLVVNDMERPAGVPPDAPIAIDRLSFLVNISHVSVGVHNYRAQIVSPAGVMHGQEILMGEAKTEKGKSHTLILEAKPFVLAGEGIYKLDFYIDNIPHSFPFEVRINP